MFAVLYALVRRRGALHLLDSAGEAGRETARPPRPLTVVVFTITLALATYLCRFVVPNETYVPVLGLPSPSFMPEYTSFIVLDVLAYRHGWPQPLSRAAGRVGFAVATATTLAYLPFVTTVKVGALGGRGTCQSLVSSAWESRFAVGMVLGLTVSFRERLNRRGHRRVPVSPRLRPLPHPRAVLVGLGFVFRWLHAPEASKFALLGPASVLGSPTRSELFPHGSCAVNAVTASMGPDGSRSECRS
ncbi:hypothetical protein [Streptomyces inhibens]|uniref:hypothetical protein n=1 Tax=Streptomyces inhibens TaxID=2293571 RepID=UPI000FFB8ADB|nr:hypothetical protein [Streptomyces inhibens]